MVKQVLAFMAASAFLCPSAATFRVNGIDYKTVEGSSSSCMVTWSETSVYKGEISIPSSVSYDGNNYSVTGIDEYAFAGSEDLSGVSIPSSVMFVGRNAFQGCYSLREMKFPEGVGEIAEQTFYGCNSLVSFSGKGIKAVGPSAFSNCSALVGPEFAPSLKYIGESAFRNCSALREFHLPDNLELSESVFAGCSDLGSVALPKGLTVLPAYTFSDCIALESVKGAEALVEIDEYAFSNCVSLRSLSLSQDLGRINKGAFSFCSSLDLNEIKGKDLVIAEGAFDSCLSLISLYLKGVVSVGEEAFANCTSLQTVSFDSSMHDIGDRAFRNCNAIETVWCEALQPPFISNHTFTDETYRNAVLMVYGSVKLLYMQTPPWSNFMNVVSGIDSVDDDGPSLKVECIGDNLSVSGARGSVSVYSISGKKVFEGGMDSSGTLSVGLPFSGIYIVSCDGKSVKVVSR